MRDIHELLDLNIWKAMSRPKPKARKEGLSKLDKLRLEVTAARHSAASGITGFVMARFEAAG